jgi:hypothetical protein
LRDRLSSSYLVKKWGLSILSLSDGRTARVYRPVAHQHVEFTNEFKRRLDHSLGIFEGRWNSTLSAANTLKNIHLGFAVHFVIRLEYSAFCNNRCPLGF